MSGQTGSATVLEELAARLARPVTADDRARAVWHLADWMSCAIGGAGEPAARILLSRQNAGGTERAFAWGGLGNILEMDDVDKRALLHPGPSIVPAALVLAAERGLSLDALLDAIVRGYEATIRLGRAVGPGHYAKFHNTGTCGGIGAAVAAADLLGLGKDETAHAMSLAISQAAGLWQTRHDPSSMGKQLHTAHAARAGMESALLAADGFVGPLTILEGPQGFFAGLCPGGDPKDVLGGEETWAIHEVSFKPWPACRHAHAAIDAALLLRERFAPHTEGRVLVETYGDALAFCDRPDPASVIEAKFSLQHAVAAVWKRGRPILADFSDEAIQDPEIGKLRQRIDVVQAADIDDAYPKRFGARIVFGDEVFFVPDALGDPENPLSQKEIAEKAHMLMMAGGAEREEVQRVVGEVFGQETSPSHLSDWLAGVLS
ncbi:MAG: MmgE/PrpD family protein [Parvularcula sp.]|jgi:2-methylcitrate dehydratase PrpD|nr:MmgE/PrpD family protein [Parvularcula sp.]